MHIKPIFGAVLATLFITTTMANTNKDGCPDCQRRLERCTKDCEEDYHAKPKTIAVCQSECRCRFRRQYYCGSICGIAQGELCHD